MRIGLLACCLFLAGCGSPKVRIANAGAGLQTWCMPMTLAATLGFYKEEGVAVELENMPSSVKALQALVGGSVDVVGLPYPQAIQMAANGQRVRSFFIMNRRDTKVLLVSPSANGRIRRAEDLRGELVGVSAPGTITDLWMRYYLANHGVPDSEYRTVAIGIGAPAFAAIESGRVAAAGVAGGDHFHLLRRHPELRILVDTNTPEGMRESYGGDTFAGGAISAKQEWLDRNPDAARRLARALRRAQQWIVTHTPEEIREKLPEGFRSRDAGVDIEILRWSQGFYTDGGAMPKGAPEAMRKMLDATVENVRNARIDLAATWTDEYLPEGK